MDSERKTVAAYLPFSTFLTALDHLANITIPNVIEMRTFPSLSYQSSSQVISAFKFFDLIDENGSPKPLLSDLAHNKDERKALIKKLLETHYPDIISLDLAKISNTQLDNALSTPRYNVAGDTRKKAKTFLLKAAQHVGFTVHPLLTKVTRNRRKGVEKKATSTGTPLPWGKKDSNDNIAETGTDSGTTHAHKPRGSEKVIQLKSGAGSVTLSLNVDLLGLDEGEDRDFVFDLIDKLRAYEKGLKVLTFEEVNKVENQAGETEAK